MLKQIAVPVHGWRWVPGAPRSAGPARRPAPPPPRSPPPPPPPPL